MDNMTQYKDYKKFKQDFETEIFNYAEANCYESDDFDKCFDFYQDYHGLEDCYIKVRIKAQEEIDRYKEALSVSHINWRTENLEVEKLKKEISLLKEELKLATICIDEIELYNGVDHSKVQVLIRMNKKARKIIQ